VDVWIADADGANPIRLTFFETGFTGSPQFSPDGEWVAFDAVVDEQLDVLTVRTAGGTPRRLTPRGSNEFSPTWSRDGRRIYFGSDRTGSDQVWRMRADGGEALQVTREGGFGGYESSDGKVLYYGKGSNETGVWRIPLQGGPEEAVLADEPSGPFARDWTLVANRLYYLKSRNPATQSLQFLDLSTRQTKRVLDLPRPVCHSYSPDLAISPDERTMLTCFEDPGESDIMLIENFR